MSVTSYITVAAMMFSFILLCIVFFLRSRMMQMLKIIKNHSKRIEKLENEIQKYRRPQIFEPQSFSPQVETPPQVTESFIDPPDMSDFVDEEVPEPVPQPVPKPKPVKEKPQKQVPNEDVPQKSDPPQPASNVSRKCAEFLKAYALLRNVSDVDLRQVRDEFINKFNVTGINCVNGSTRMKQPEIEPEFAEILPVPSGEYWAYEIEPNIYAVVPNVKAYTERYHVAHAMEQVFESNFKAGRTYKHIEVEVPAIFERVHHNWRLNHQGKLFLK